MKRFTELVRSSPFLRHNAIFFTGSMVVAALNYLFYPVLGRLMSPADFGEAQALLSLFTQAAVFFGILSYVVIHVTVNTQDKTTRNQILANLERIALVGGGGLLLVTLLFIPWLKSFLNFTHALPFVALVAALAVSIPLTLRMAFLRGRKLFFKSSVADGVGSAAKLMLAVVFVVIGLRSFGVILGLAISQVLSLIMVVVWARQAGLSLPAVSDDAKSRLASLKPQFRYALAVFVGSSVVMAMFNLDILAIKHYFPPEQAGLYSGMAVVARVAFFVCAPFTAVLITMVSWSQPARKNILQLKGTLGLTLVLGGVAVLMLSLFSDFFVKLLVGSEYLVYADQLPKLALAMLLLSLTNALLMYHIALKYFRLGFSAVCMLVFALLLVQANHGTIQEVVNSLVIGCLGLFVVVSTHSIVANKTGKVATNA